MRRVLLSLAAFGLAASLGTVQAQTPERAPGRSVRMVAPGDPVARLLEQREALGLTAEQVARLEQIRSRLEQQNRPLRERLRAQQEELRKQREARLQALTPEQRELLGAMRPGAMRGRGGERLVMPRQATPEQREEMRKRAEEIRQRAEEARRRAEAARERWQQLTPEQREELRKLRMELGDEMRKQAEALRPTIQQIAENQRTAWREARDVLTAEQKDKLEELRKERMGEQRGRVMRPGAGMGARRARGFRAPGAHAPAMWPGR